MPKHSLGAIIIQDSAGSGKAIKTNKETTEIVNDVIKFLRAIGMILSTISIVSGANILNPAKVVAAKPL